MEKRVDPNGETLVWCRKCSGHARCRRPETMDTEEHRKMLTRKLTQEEMVRDSNARGWKVKGERRRVTRKECKRLREAFEVGGFMA